jgi:hypothetical protein
LSSPTPAERAGSRFRLPVEAPTRDLLIASLAPIAGACQLFAWALAHLPPFFLVLGLVLVGLGVGIALAALVRYRRMRWVVYVGPESLTVAQGRRRTVLPWAEVAGVRYADFRLEVTGRDGTRMSTLPVDRTRPAHREAQTLERAIADRISPAR